MGYAHCRLYMYPPNRPKLFTTGSTCCQGKGESSGLPHPPNGADFIGVHLLAEVATQEDRMRRAGGGLGLSPSPSTQSSEQIDELDELDSYASMEEESENRLPEINVYSPTNHPSL